MVLFEASGMLWMLWMLWMLSSTLTARNAAIARELAGDQYFRLTKTRFALRCIVLISRTCKFFSMLSDWLTHKALIQIRCRDVADLSDRKAESRLFETVTGCLLTNKLPEEVPFGKLQT